LGSSVDSVIFVVRVMCMRTPLTRSPLAFAFRLILLAGSVSLGSVRPAAAQDWYPAPITAWSDRIVLGGGVTAGVSTADDGYFNYTNYDHDTLRLVRLNATTLVRPGSHVSFLLELRAEGDSREGHWTAAAYAAYVRLKPWARAIEFEGGIVPPAFGAFPSRSYPGDNLLIGYPLAYHYLTSLRADAVPASADELVAHAAQGWQTGYSVGSSDYDTGVPMAVSSRYDAGLRVRLGTTRSRFEALSSVTTGTLANPGLDHNGSPQVAARVVFRPVVGLVLGGSASQGDFLDGHVHDVLPQDLRGERYSQTAWGWDAEYSRGYWLVRGEMVGSRWHMPAIAAPYLPGALTARSWYVEGRYKIVPGMYVAARYDTLTFGDVVTTDGRLPWDSDVSRTEFGVGVALGRTVTVKGTVQHNWRDAGRVTRSTLPALQVVLWF
jgi:hypothetical protein